MQRCICGRKHRTISERDCLRRNSLEAILKRACLIRDHGRCQRCEKSNGQLQLSHVLPRGRCGRLKFDLQNVQILCPQCHFWWHEFPTESGLWFAREWPERLAYLKKERVLQPHGTIPLEWYRQRYRELEEYIRQSIPRIGESDGR